MSTPDLLVHYANILAIETKIERYTGPQWDTLVDGLDTLRICSELFSSANNHELGKILAYICALTPRHQTTLFTVLAIVFETMDWMRFERRAVKREEFEISAVVWVLKIGPKGLALGRSKGKTELGTLLAAEEAWIDANQNAIGYNARRKTLAQLAAGLVEWVRPRRGFLLPSRVWVEDDACLLSMD
jgi:hypothetical protein